MIIDICEGNTMKKHYRILMLVLSLFTVIVCEGYSAKSGGAGAGSAGGEVMPNSEATLVLTAIGVSTPTLAKFDPKSDKSLWNFRTP